MAEPGTSEIERSQLRKALVASTVGTAIEWYDFFLYGTISALVFPKLYFPHSDPYAGLLASFSIYFVGFLARPIGGAIFGHYGDRIGRKATLIATLMLMGLGTFAVGLVPIYASVGVWGAVILTLLRVCQGLGVGGEWGGSVLLAMEWGYGRRRGYIASWPQLGVPLGLLVSSALVAIFNSATGPAFLAWGWRIPFLLSIVLVAIGLWIRLSILETPLFTRLLDAKRVAQAPVPEVLRRNWREVILSALVRMSEQAPFYIFITFVLSYSTTNLKLDRGPVVTAVTLAAVLSLFTVPFFGWLSDRIGRKKTYLLGAVATLVWAFPYFALLNTRSMGLVYLAIIVSLIPHDMQYGPQAALIAESFPTRLRYSGASIGYQLASIVAGGPAPSVAVVLLAHYHTAYAISLYIVFNAVVTILATLALKDRSREDISYEAELGAEAVRPA